jgi:hypothetical protein
VPERQTPFWQQPPLQLLWSQAAPQVPPPTLRGRQEIAFPAQAVQLCPPEPQALSAVPDSQAEPRQQPEQLKASHPELELEELVVPAPV